MFTHVDKYFMQIEMCSVPSMIGTNLHRLGKQLGNKSKLEGERVSSGEFETSAFPHRKQLEILQKLGYAN